MFCRIDASKCGIFSLAEFNSTMRKMNLKEFFAADNQKSLFCATNKKN